jgi:hypothetical protein
VTTAQIYKGSIAFIVLQIIMVATIIAFPQLVTGGIEQGVKIDADKALQEMVMPEAEPQEAAPQVEPSASEPQAPKEEDADDPMKALEDSMKKDGVKK